MAITFIIHDVNPSGIFSTNSEAFTGVSEESCEVLQLFKGIILCGGYGDRGFPLIGNESNGGRDRCVVGISYVMPRKYLCNICLLAILPIHH
jgi:hypothetical protein